MPKRKRGNHPLGLRRSPPPERLRRRVGGYVKMRPDDRREAVAELKGEGHSNREIAKLIGVDEKTVRNDDAEFSAPIQGISRKINGADDAPAEFSAPAESEPAEDDDDGDDDQMSPKEIAHRAKMAFLLRANEAKNFGMDIITTPPQRIPLIFLGCGQAAVLPSATGPPPSHDRSGADTGAVDGGITGAVDEGDALLRPRHVGMPFLWST